MKRFLLIALVCVVPAAAADAQTTKIELYADAAGTNCELVDQGTAIRVVYALLTGTVQSTAVRFKAPRPACWLGAIFAGNTTPYVPAGTTEIDWSVGFGGCVQLPLVVGQINFYATGGAQPCCEIVAMPAFQFVYTDCNYGEHPLTAGQKVVINPNSSCRCQSPLAVEPTTWGRVKSLYR